MECSIMECLNGCLFSDMRREDKKLYVIQWCQAYELIASRSVCPKCNGGMALTARKELTDGYEWMCRYRGANAQAHSCKQSVRKGSWFSESRLEIWQVLLITYMWVMEAKCAHIMNDACVSIGTVTEWSSYCQEVCQNSVIAESESLGGMGVVVEIVEKMLGKRKYERGTCVNGNWVYGGLERGSFRWFFRIVENRSKESLLDVIKTFVKPGSIVISNCWSSYCCLEDENFRTLRENDSLSFKDPEERTCIKSNEGLWGAIEKKLRGRQSETQFNPNLYEYLWRRKYGHLDGTERMKQFIRSIKLIYNQTNV